MLSLDSVPTWLIVLVAIYLSLPLVFYYIIPYVFYGDRSTRKRIIIYVLGDLGHSPRMCYHARSFSDKKFQVELCGYVDSKLPDFISNDSNITVHPIPRIAEFGMIRKVIFQVICIIGQLWELRGSDYLLMQNPPCIPILPIVAFYRLTGCKLIIDWHNLAYSILALKFNENQWHPLVLVAWVIEFIFSKAADYHLTVTEAMKKYLVCNFKINEKRCVVLYDRPASQFKPFDSTKENRSNALRQAPFLKGLVPEDFDIEKGDKVIVTSTSFTPDEDIGVLFSALKIYESSVQKFDENLPKILCFVTGKGPLKESFVKEVNDHKWNHVHIEFLWLSSEDYPRLLQLCDYGVSLHKSSSGLDLPMKILDMFGSGLPVMTMNYPTINELVVQDVNGVMFTDRREMHEALIFLMKDSKVNQKLKDGAIAESKNKWEPTWEKSMEQLKIIR